MSFARPKKLNHQPNVIRLLRKLLPGGPDSTARAGGASRCQGGEMR